MIIENKIDAPDGPGQLGWYERKAKQLCKAYSAKGNQAKQLLLYLTNSNKIPPENWVALTYVDLAAALRRVWIAHRKREAAGIWWLRLYIATIMRNIRGMQVEHLQELDLCEMHTYFGEAV